jgi:hypothetical protein
MIAKKPFKQVTKKQYTFLEKEDPVFPGDESLEHHKGEIFWYKLEFESICYEGEIIRREVR